MLAHIIEKISQSKGSRSEGWTLDESQEDPAEHEFRQWKRPPEGIVTGYLMDMNRQQLREMLRTVDRELDNVTMKSVTWQLSK